MLNLSSAELLAPTRVQIHRTNYSKYVKNLLGIFFLIQYKRECIIIMMCSLSSAELLAPESIEHSEKIGCQPIVASSYIKDFATSL